MVSKEQIQHVAKLARLGLSNEELEKIGKELSSILDYFKLLDELDVSQTTPAFYALPFKNIMREDKVEKKDKEQINELLSQAPSRKGKYIKVKEILK